MSAQTTFVAATIGHEAATRSNSQSAAFFEEAAHARENHWFRARDRELMARLRKTLPATSLPVASRSFEGEGAARDTGLLMQPVAHSQEDLWFHMHDHELIERMRKSDKRS
jgi:hypothetical protein